MKASFERPITCKYIIGTTSGKKKEWKKIIINGYKTNYSVRENGDVINRNTQKLLHRYDSQKGYKYYTFSIDHKSYTINIYRLLACVFIPIPKRYIEQGYGQANLEVTAKDGNLENLELDNLQWITMAEKGSRTSREGRACSGESCHLTKLTEEQARQICAYLQDGKKAKYIREHMTGVTDSMIYAIKYRSTWKNISKDYTW